MVEERPVGVVLRLAVAIALTLVGCGGGDSAGNPSEAPEKLTSILEEVLRQCGDDGASAEACKRATNAPSWMPPKNIKVPPGFLSVMVIESCEREGFVELEGAALTRSGGTHIRAGFLRRDDGEWFLGRISMVDDSTPKLCEDIPLAYGVEEAKKGLEDAQSDWVVWSREDGKDVLDLRPLWSYQCELKSVMFGGSPEEEPERVDVGCWLSDGFPIELGKKGAPPFFKADEIGYVYVQLVFVDGTKTEIVKIENPSQKGR